MILDNIHVSVFTLDCEHLPMLGVSHFLLLFMELVIKDIISMDKWKNA